MDSISEYMRFHITDRFWIVVKVRRRLCVGVIAAVSMVTSAVLISPPVTVADNASSSPLADEVAASAAAAFDAVIPGDDVVEPVASNGELVASTGDTVVTVSTDADDPVEFESSTGESFSFTMPALAEPTSSVVGADGTVAFGDEGSAVSTSVQALKDGGVRALVVLSDASAPSQYRFDIEVAVGQHLQTFADGTAAVVDAAGIVVVPIGAAGAVDAAGASLPTWYSIEGDTLVQNIDLSNTAISYPVVADPCFWGWRCARRIVRSAVGGAGAIGGCVLGALPTAWGGGFGCLPGAAGGAAAGAAAGAFAGWWG